MIAYRVNAVNRDLIELMVDGVPLLPSDEKKYFLFNELGARMLIPKSTFTRYYAISRHISKAKERYFVTKR